MRRRVITRRPMLVVLACMLVSLRAVMALATTPITLEIVGDWRVQVTGHLPDGDRHAVLDVPPAHGALKIEATCLNRAIAKPTIE